MSNKITLTRADATFGKKVMRISTKSAEIAMTMQTEPTEEQLKELIDKGYSLFIMEGEGSYVVWRSKEVNSDCTSVTDDNYEHLMKLSVFVPQEQWKKNVQDYFSRMMEDESALCKIREVIKPALETPCKSGNTPFDAVDTLLSICDDMANLSGSEKTQGSRRPNIFKAIVNSHKVWQFKGELVKAVEKYVRENKQWKR